MDRFFIGQGNLRGEKVVLSRENLEWVLQKCTEVGVKRFVPIETFRSIVRKEPIKVNKSASRLADKMKRWQRII